MPLNQSQFMREFNETHREEFNPQLFERDSTEIVEAIRQVLLSCERDKYYTLKLLSFDVIYNYEEIYDTLRNHEENRKKKNDKTENSYNFINIRDTDIILIKVKWFIRHNGSERVEDDGKSTEIFNPEEILEVLIAVPRFVKKYYFRLSGNYYSTIFQIVDGSTYNNSTASQSKVDTVTLKTMFMPIRIFRGFNDKLKDRVTGAQIKAIEYQSIIFGVTINVMYYIFAAFGFYDTLRFMEIRCIRVDSKPIEDPDWYNFEKSGIFISAYKRAFDEDAVVQSVVATIYDAIRKDVTIWNIFSNKFWLENLGTAFKTNNNIIEKAGFVLDSLEGIYDNDTMNNLHLPMKDKENIYCVLRWVMREFSNLRIKENTDVRTKRIRIPEYIAAVYAAKLSKSIVRISDLGSKVTLKKVVQAVYTNPMYVISSISVMSNLVSYNDLVNDLDSLTALKYTYKGISGLGEDGTAIQPVYRYVDPSHVGILDMDASSASDPGMSGMICPMAKLYGEEHSFSDYQEPNEWRDNYGKYQTEVLNGTRDAFTFINEPEYVYGTRKNEVVEEALDINKIRSPFHTKDDPDGLQFTTAYIQNKKIEEQNNTSLFTLD